MSLSEIWAAVSSVCIGIAFKLLGAIVVFAVGKFLIGFFIKHFPAGTEKHPMDPTAHNFIKNILKTVLYVIMAVIIVGILGVPMASVIAVVGSAGAAIALALQGSLANLASGIVILIIKPLKLGDYIEVSGVSGTVSDLGIFCTTLITPDNKHITIPNSAITTSTVVNYSREENRRLDLVFAVDYSADTERVKEIILGIVRAHSFVLTDPEPMVRITAISAPSASYVVRVWCKAGNYWPLNFDLNEQIKGALDANGIAAPLPKVGLIK